MNTEKTEFFFVYGTLKEDGFFAQQFDDFRVNSEKAELSGYDLFNLGWFPGIVEGSGKVIGELHEYKGVERVTNNFDRIEGYSEEHKEHSLYLRKRASVTTNSGKEVEANIYVLNGEVPTNAEKVEDGDWDLKKYAK